LWRGELINYVIARNEAIANFARPLFYVRLLHSSQ
jgi:hypothetical protein